MNVRGTSRVVAQWLLAGVLLASAASLAEDAKARAAREELERQLGQLVGKVPTRVRVELLGLDEPNYVLEEASFELDGRSLGAPALGQLNREGTHLVWSGDVAPGKHLVAVRLVYSNASSIVLSDEGGYKWKVGGSVGFDVNAGIEVRVKVSPSRDGTQPDIAKRFRLSLPAQPVMLAALDDGSMPPPPPKPVLAEVDAGPSPAELAALEKQRLLAEAEAQKRLAAEEKARKAAEALEAKRLAAEEKERKAAELLEAKRVAAELKQRQVEEAREAKRLAAEERKRLAAGGAPLAVAAPASAVEPTPAADTTPAELDAGSTLPEPEPFDAGLLAAAEPTPAPVPAVLPPEEPFPWPLALGAGAVVLLVLLVVLARRSARPPRIDD